MTIKIKENVSLLNQKGISMVQVLIAAAMMGGLALVLAKLWSNSAKTQRGAMVSTEINQFVNKIEKQFLHADACRWTFGENTSSLNPGPNTLGDLGNGDIKYLDQLIDLKGYPHIKKDDGNPATTDDIISPNLLISEIKVQRGNNAPVPPLLTNLMDYQLRVSITFRKINDGLDNAGNPSGNRRSFGANLITKYFHIDALFNGADEVTRCYSQMDNAINTALQISCENYMGGTFDPDTKDCNTIPALEFSVYNTITLNVPRNSSRTANSGGAYPLCVLSRVRSGGDEGGATDHCTITKNGLNWWTITGARGDDPAITCRMICMR